MEVSLKHPSLATEGSSAEQLLINAVCLPEIKIDIYRKHISKRYPPKKKQQTNKKQTPQKTPKRDKKQNQTIKKSKKTNKKKTTKKPKNKKQTQQHMYRGLSYSFTMKNLIKNHSLNFPFCLFMQFLLAPQMYVICVIDDMYLTIRYKLYL